MPRGHLGGAVLFMAEGWVGPYRPLFFQLCRLRARIRFLLRLRLSASAWARYCSLAVIQQMTAVTNSRTLVNRSM